MADDLISVKIEADASGLESGAKQASDSADQISEKLQGIQGAAGAGAEGMGALEAAYYSVSGPAQILVGPEPTSWGIPDGQLRQ
jgi:hypothetical protein